jgi:hypothetical protein
MPNVYSPLAVVNNSLDTLKTLKFQKPVVKQSAVAACEAARQACKHVDIAAKPGLTASWPTMQNRVPMYSPMQQVPQPSYPQLPPAPPQWWNDLDKDQMIALMNAQAKNG